MARLDIHQLWHQLSDIPNPQRASAAARHPASLLVDLLFKRCTCVFLFWLHLWQTFFSPAHVYRMSPFTFCPATHSWASVWPASQPPTPTPWSRLLLFLSFLPPSLPSLVLASPPLLVWLFKAHTVRFIPAVSSFLEGCSGDGEKAAKLRDNRSEERDEKTACRLNVNVELVSKSKISLSRKDHWIEKFESWHSSCKSTA